MTQRNPLEQVDIGLDETIIQKLEADMIAVTSPSMAESVMGCSLIIIAIVEGTTEYSDKMDQDYGTQKHVKSLFLKHPKLMPHILSACTNRDFRSVRNLSESFYERIKGIS